MRSRLLSTPFGRKWLADIGPNATGPKGAWSAIATDVLFDPTSGSSPVSLTADAAIGRWVALDATVSVGGVSLTADVAVGSWVALDASVSTASPTNLTADVAVGRWVALDATRSVGGLTRSDTPAVGRWVALDAVATPGGVSRTDTPAIARLVALDATRSAAVSRTADVAVGRWVALDATLSVASPVNLTADVAVGRWVALDATVIAEGTEPPPQQGMPGGAILPWDRSPAVRYRETLADRRRALARRIKKGRRPDPVAPEPEALPALLPAPLVVPVPFGDAGPAEPAMPARRLQETLQEAPITTDRMPLPFDPPVAWTGPTMLDGWAEERRLMQNAQDDEDMRMLVTLLAHLEEDE